MKFCIQRERERERERDGVFHHCMQITYNLQIAKLLLQIRVHSSIHLIFFNFIIVLLCVKFG